MRRCIALLFAIVLPLKALAAVVVPIVGTPDHVHAAAQVQAHEGQAHEHPAGSVQADAADDRAHTCCPGLSGQSPAQAGTLHDHTCPHLAMATLVPALPVVEIDARVAVTPPRAVPPFISVVLDLPVPPPTRQS